VFKEIKKCRICGNENLEPILDLGTQKLTGVFPKSSEQSLTAGPLELVKCSENNGKNCGLVQLRHSFDNTEMYGENYGYRSGLNQSMVLHLHNKVKKILGLVSLDSQDMIIDIGSNDSTLLQAYPERGQLTVGIDPTGIKFKKYYPEHIQLIPEFFSAATVENKFGKKKAKIITSIAMFYDLESPMDFVSQIHQTLAKDGIWTFEQSYLPTMLEVNAYDTVCHEHLEYYRLKQIKWMMDRVGFKIIDLELNPINGGSFSLTVAKVDSPYQEITDKVDAVMHKEEKMGLGSLKPYREFEKRVEEHRNQLIEFIRKAKKQNKTIFGYGASTKGNVILQFCNLSSADIPFIAEVNENKFGCYTPGTLIPIISEREARAMKPDYFMVLPWHFRDGIIKREKEYMQKGGNLFFPLPIPEVISK